MKTVLSILWRFVVICVGAVMSLAGVLFVTGFALSICGPEIILVLPVILILATSFIFACGWHDISKGD